MMRTLALACSLALLSACANTTPDRGPMAPDREETPAPDAPPVPACGAGPDGKVARTDREWRRLLTDEQFRVTRRAGTERAFSGAYWDHKGDGLYRCAGCGQALFDSRHKFSSGTGWPSYWAPAGEGVVATRTDESLGVARVEVLCARCDAHLGHVFPDGPKPTGLRYCINSAALTYEPRKAGAKKK